MQTTTLDTSQFTGTSTWWRHPLNHNVTYTDGAKYVAETAKAYWLLDKIALQDSMFGKRVPTFQVWDLAVKDNRGVITVTDGDENLVATYVTPYTDFPEPGVKLFFIDGVILVPSEY